MAAPQLDPLLSSFTPKTIRAMATSCDSDLCRAPKTDKKLLLCSGCKMTQYCNKQCQTNAWSAHKENCKSVQAERAKRDADPSSQAHSPIPGMPVSDAIAAIRSWSHYHRPSIMNAATSALKFRSAPATCNSNVLLLTLEPTEKGLAGLTRRGHKMFRLKSADVVPFDADSLVGARADIDAVLAKPSMIFGQKQSVAIIIAQCGICMSLAPFNWTPQDLFGLKELSDADWKVALANAVAPASV